VFERSEPKPFCMVGQHVLARNLQRGPTGTIQGMVADLRVLYERGPTAPQEAVDEGVCLDVEISVVGGAWRGAVFNSRPESGVVDQDLHMIRYLARGAAVHPPGTRRCSHGSLKAKPSRENRTQLDFFIPMLPANHEKFKRVDVVRWTAQQWEQLRAAADEPMCDFGEYQRRTDRNIELMRARDMPVVEVTGDVSEFFTMCRVKGMRVDSKARAAYAAWLAQRKGQH
jgi:hypothetical protein